MISYAGRLASSFRLPVKSLFILLVVAVYTAYPVIARGGDMDVPGTDAEWLAFFVFNEGYFPYRYYGHYFYLIFNPQLYYYLTPAIVMIPAIWIKLDRWFVVWLVVLMGGFGYIRHMFMGSFLPIINYMVFIPLNLMLLNKHHYRWLVVAMFASLMFHGSSGVIIQTGTFLCMLTRFKWKDWVAVMPLALPAVGIYILNHQLAPSIASQVVNHLTSGDLAEGNPDYLKYLSVIRQNGMLGRFDWANYLPVNWYFYYFGLPLIAAATIIGVAWAKRPEFRPYMGQLARFTLLPLVIVIMWWAMADIRTHTFDMADRAANALSILIFMATGLGLAALREGVHPERMGAND